jgi:hypothetical protein
MVSLGPIRCPAQLHKHIRCICWRENAVHLICRLRYRFIKRTIWLPRVSDASSADLRASIRRRDHLFRRGILTGLMVYRHRNRFLTAIDQTDLVVSQKKPLLACYGSTCVNAPPSDFKLANRSGAPSRGLHQERKS